VNDADKCNGCDICFDRRRAQTVCDFAPQFWTCPKSLVSWEVCYYRLGWVGVGVKEKLYFHA
jgi:hypothetical protein